MITITRQEAADYLIKYQHINLTEKLKTDNEIVSFIERVGCIQYDPLSTTARNADLVLNNRIKNFTSQQLSDLLYTKRLLYDYWDKNMAILSVKDWPFFHRRREYFKDGYRHREKELRNARTEILELLKEQESVCSKDIKNNRKVDWSWAPTNIARAALESLYHTGELSIHHKKGTRKYYGLTRNLLPEAIRNQADPNRDNESYTDWNIKRRIDSIGLLWNRSGDGWLGCHCNKQEREISLRRLLETGRIEKMIIEGLKEPVYISKNNLETYMSKKLTGRTSFIAPLDNLIWDRRLIDELFGFRYKWEVYTPVKDRKYGYYVLPVLYRNKFVARFEPVVNRKENVLVIKNWWWEQDVKMTKAMKESVRKGIDLFRIFLGVGELQVLAEAEIEI